MRRMIWTACWQFSVISNYITQLWNNISNLSVIQQTCAIKKNSYHLYLKEGINVVIAKCVLIYGVKWYVYEKTNAKKEELARESHTIGDKQENYK